MSFMKKIFVISIIIASLFSATKVSAQSDPMFTQSMFNTLSVNPAYAGSTDTLSLTAISRHQWIGFEGAPTTQTFSGHAAVNDYLGAGLSLMHDLAGPIRNMALKANLSYSITITEKHSQYESSFPRNFLGKSELSFGLMAGVSNYNIGLTDLENVNPENSAFHSDINKYQPIFGAGLYYSFKDGYLGFSVPDLIETTYENENAGTWTHNRHYFLMGGYISKLNPNFKLRTTFMMRYVQNAPLSAQINVSAIYQDKFGFGLSYRYNDAVGAHAFFQINNQFRIGYSYDYSIQSLSNYQSGSHEIMLNYVFKSKQSEFSSPRYF